jgi:hypothetical protein
MIKVDSPIHAALTVGLFTAVVLGLVVASELAGGYGMRGVLRVALVFVFALGLSTMIVFKGKRRAR